MSDSNVIPFRKRPPAEMGRERYERMTRDWHPELKQLMFPEYCEREAERKTTD